MLSLLLYLVIVCIIVWGVSQAPIPEPFNFVRVVIYCFLAIWLVVLAFKVFTGTSLPSLR